MNEHIVDNDPRMTAWREYQLSEANRYKSVNDWYETERHDISDLISGRLVNMQPDEARNYVQMGIDNVTRERADIASSTTLSASEKSNKIMGCDLNLAIMDIYMEFAGLSVEEKQAQQEAFIDRCRDVIEQHKLRNRQQILSEYRKTVSNKFDQLFADLERTSPRARAGEGYGPQEIFFTIIGMQQAIDEIEDASIKQKYQDIYDEELMNHPDLAEFFRDMSRQREDQVNPGEFQRDVHDPTGGDGDGNGNGDGDGDGGGDDTDPDGEEEEEEQDQEIDPEQPVEGLEELPERITNNPKVSWRTITALAVGIAAGVSAVVFLPAGIGVGVAVVGGGLLKAVAGRRRNKLAAERMQNTQEYNRCRATIAQQEAIIASNNEVIADMEAMLAAVPEEQRGPLEERIAARRAQNEQANAVIQEATRRGAEIRERLTVRAIAEPQGFVKGAGARFMSYLRSEEFMRDLQWLGNGAIFSAAASQMLGWGGIGITPKGTPSIGGTGGGTTPQPQPQPTQGHHIGDSVDDLNLTHGHDSAEWAINGTNKEHLIQNVMHDGNSVYQGAYIQNPTTGVQELYNGPLSMEELVAKYGNRVSFRIGDSVTGIGRSFETAAELGLDATNIGGVTI